jgi:hypothetical protein
MDASTQTQSATPCAHGVFRWLALASWSSLGSHVVAAYGPPVSRRGALAHDAALAVAGGCGIEKW